MFCNSFTFKFFETKEYWRINKKLIYFTMKLSCKFHKTHWLDKWHCLNQEDFVKMKLRQFIFLEKKLIFRYEYYLPTEFHFEPFHSNSILCDHFNAQEIRSEDIAIPRIRLEWRTGGSESKVSRFQFALKEIFISNFKTLHALFIAQLSKADIWPKSQLLPASLYLKCYVLVL